MSNILITGSSGFIGSRLIDFLGETHTCLGVSRKTGVDITDLSCLQRLDFKVDIIIHAAASLSNEFEESFDTNVIGTLNICKYAQEKKVNHIILISSIFIFNNNKNEYFNNYGQSKKQSEEVAESFCKENNIKLTILRLSQVYDEKKEAIKSQRMLYFFIDSVKKNKKVCIFGKKNPLRNYIHINDVIYIIDDVLKNLKIGTFNIVNTKSHSVTEIAYIIFDILRIQPNIEYLEKEEDMLSMYIPMDKLYILNKKFIDIKYGIMEILSYEK